MFVFKQLFTFSKACCSTENLTAHSALVHDEDFSQIYVLNTSHGLKSSAYMVGTATRKKLYNIGTPGTNVIKLFTSVIYEFS
jgi:hypothetical protein